jgi:hypothetical protein
MDSDFEREREANRRDVARSRGGDDFGSRGGKRRRERSPSYEDDYRPPAQLYTRHYEEDTRYDSHGRYQSDRSKAARYAVEEAVDPYYETKPAKRFSDPPVLPPPASVGRSPLPSWHKHNGPSDDENGDEDYMAINVDAYEEEVYGRGRRKPQEQRVSSSFPLLSFSSP